MADETCSTPTIGSQIRPQVSIGPSKPTNPNKILLHDLLTQPEDYVMAIEHYSVSIASVSGWGRRISITNDYVIQRALDFIESVNLIVPGQFLMEAFPGLATLPRWIDPIPNAMKKGVGKVQRYFYELSKEAAENGKTETESFATGLMAAQEKSGISDKEVAQLTGKFDWWRGRYNW